MSPIIKRTTGRRPKRVMALVAVTAAGWSSAAVSAPITFNTALPVAKGEFIVREQLVVNQSGDDPGGADRDRTSRAIASVLGYGVSGKFAVFSVLPYLDNELQITTGGQRVTRSTSGFGDLTVLGRYTVVQRDRPGRNFRVAPFLGIKAPTGEDDATDPLGRLPPNVQVGSGSWDPFVGVVATYQTLDYQLDSQFSYRANNEANRFRSGDIVRLDGSLQYRLRPRELTGGVPGFLYGVIEVNLAYHDRNHAGGLENPDSGGTRVFLTPGVQYVTRRWIVEGSVQIPVSQDLNGAALENGYIARAGFRWNF